MSEFPPLVYVDVYKTRPPRYRGKARRQPWRWRAINADNRKVMASGEAYTNEADCLAAVQQLFGDKTNCYLRRHEFGNAVLRMATDG